MNATERVAQLARERVPGHRVDGEIAPGEIALDVAEERDGAGPPSVEIGPLAAKGGHLDFVVVREHGDGAVRDAGRRRATEETLHVFR